jgi:hypothetical protein
VLAGVLLHAGLAWTTAGGELAAPRLAAFLPGPLRGRPRDERCELGDEVVGGRVEPAARDLVIPARKKAWEASLGGEEAAKPHIRARLTAWPRRLLVDGARLPGDDRAFVERLARDTWRGLVAFTDREHHLPVDHVRFTSGSVDRAGAAVGDYTNVTTVGLLLIATVAAHELDLLGRDDAVARLRALLATLARLERASGFFFNYYDTTSLERTSNLLSFVDSAWLTAGLMVVRTTFSELRDDCTRLIDATDYRFFYDSEVGRMAHGYWVHQGRRSRYHYGVLYAESRLGSLIAIGKGDVSPDHWFRMVRTFPRACTWQTGVPRGRRRKTIRGITFAGGWYEWQDVRFVPSWGGSMFEALMPTLVLDEGRWARASLGANDAAHATVQRRWGREVLGVGVWGFSPSSTPANDGYGEYGVRVLGTLGYAPGAVTPHAVALALAVTPAEAIAGLRALADRYDVYGEYGFYDAVDPQTGRVAHAYLALDQAMIFIAVANHLTGGAFQRWFAADPIAARALPLLGDERFFD